MLKDLITTYIINAQLFLIDLFEDGNELILPKGISEADIRKSWATELQRFKAVRAKYLLYAN